LNGFIKQAQSLMESQEDGASVVAVRHTIVLAALTPTIAALETLDKGV
jgi:hypothetical protein